jgi:hypothetical protein
MLFYLFIYSNMWHIVGFRKIIFQNQNKKIYQATYLKKQS